jgi:hypothetical protein
MAHVERSAGESKSYSSADRLFGRSTLRQIDQNSLEGRRTGQCRSKLHDVRRAAVPFSSVLGSSGALTGLFPHDEPAIGKGIADIERFARRIAGLRQPSVEDSPCHS